MLTGNEITENAELFGRKFGPPSKKMAVAYAVGYTNAQSTIRDECIQFSEWILANGFIYTIHNNRIEYIKIGDGDHRDKVVAKTTSELYSIYLESLK